MKHTRIDGQLLGGYVVAIWDCTPKQAAKHLKSIGESAESVKLMRNVRNDSSGYCLENGMRAIIWLDGNLRTVAEIGTLAHEAFHAAYALCTHRGIEGTGGEEAIAYSVGSIVTRVLRANDS